MKNIFVSKGVTLPELIIAAGLFSVVGIIMAAILLSGSSLYYLQSAKVEQRLGINEAFSSLKRNIRQSSAVVDGSSDVQLILKLPSINSQGPIINVYDHILYYYTGEKFYEIVSPDAQSIRTATDKILAQNVDNIKFEYYDDSGVSVTPVNATRVKLTLSLKQKAGAGFETNIATTEADLKNN